MDPKLNHLMRNVLHLDVIRFHPILSALEDAFYDNFIDFRTQHYDTTFFYTSPTINARTELMAVYALKLSQLIAFARNKIVIDASDRDNPVAWSKEEFHDWRAAHFDEWRSKYGS